MTDALDVTRPTLLRRLLALTATAAFSASALVVAAPTSAQAAVVTPRPGPAVGVQFHGMWSDQTDAERAKALDQYAASGMTWIRLDVSWSMLQPNGPGSYDSWGVNFVDRVITMATSRGLKPLVTLWITPKWANGGAWKYDPPTNPADYARVAEWAARRWADKVPAWEVWNEPNHESYWGGTVLQYAALLRAAYPAFKRGNPNATVVLGGPSYNDVPWLTQAYDAGAQGHFDVMATHPYQGMADLPPDAPDDGKIYRMRHVKAVYDLMVARGDGAKKIWFTEFGWSTHANTADVENWDRGVTLQQQADFCVRTLTMIAADYPYVTNVFFYRGRDGDADESPQNRNYGLLYRDLRPKPVMAALKSYLGSPTLPAPKGKAWRGIARVRLAPAWRMTKP